MNLGVTMQRLIVGTAFLLIFIGVCQGQGLVARAADSWNYISAWTLQPAAESMWILRTEDADKVIYMEFLEFNIRDESESCENYYLRITEMGEDRGTFCRGAGPSLTSQGTLVEVRVRVGANATGRGFRMRYRQMDPRREDTEASCGKYIFLNETTTTYLTSPGFPAPMPSDTDCTWVLESKPKTLIRVRPIDVSSSNCSLLLKILEVEDTISMNPCEDGDQSYLSKQNSLAVHMKNNNMDESYFNVSVEVISDAQEVCGRTINLTRIIKTEIVSPGFPAIWSEDINCTWVVQGLPGSRIRVQEVDVRMADCSYYLALSEGNDTETVRFCRGDNIDFVTAKHEVAIHLRNPKKGDVYFQLDASLTLAAPSIHGSCPPKERPEVLVATLQEGVIASKNYNYSNYEREMNCHWLISAQGASHVVEVTISNSSIESSNNCQFDYLAGYDGPNDWEPQLFRWCGSQDATYKSSSRHLTLVFSTDKHYEDRGFLLTYRQVPGRYPPEHPVKCGGTLHPSANGTHIASPGFPAPMALRTECTWIIETPPSTRIFIKAVKTSLTDCSFHLTFIEEKEMESMTFCEGPFLEYESVSNKVKVFLKDVRTDQAFFNLSVSVIQDNRTPDSVEDPHPRCGGIVHLNAGELTYIASPSYPKPMPLEIACLWHVVAQARHRIRLQNLDSILDNCGFYLGLYADNDTEIVRFCNGTDIDFVTETHEIFIFMRNYGTPGVRLNLLATSSFSPPTVIGSCPTLNASNALVATSTPQKLSSQNYKYSNYVSNMDCTWVIRADKPEFFVHVKLVNSSVQETPHCTHDFLAGYDGPDHTSPELFKWCGNESKAFTSASNYMTLLFKSDNKIEDRGFLLLYSTLAGLTPTRGDSTTTIAVSVVVPIAIIIIAVIVCVVIQRRRNAERNRDPLQPVNQSTPQNQNPQPAPTCYERLRVFLFGNKKEYDPLQTELVALPRPGHEEVAREVDALGVPLVAHGGSRDGADPSRPLLGLEGTGDPGVRRDLLHVEEGESETVPLNVRMPAPPAGSRGSHGRSASGARGGEDVQESVL